ncbi:uncharacterized protein STEHIDRAFT_119477 [Stereum hirsutum FP-91666 SS1]|uniref:uncharacterized protein n=1 Tax=Stereum hirsutum (strain FP-91666) TaxID=721885 RepID=UPI000440BAE6|nr:uncharacterized protein STEHIDRAFT_119477 [Stereum hirsutum FP-91666 SS1]EIM90494.1 hypothetical protein STEHIDRAFT_119477 [Stereum hirsutum FP-91666 SS1]
MAFIATLWAHLYQNLHSHYWPGYLWRTPGHWNATGLSGGLAMLYYGVFSYCIRDCTKFTSPPFRWSK